MFIALFIFLSAPNLRAEINPQNFHIYAGVGTALQFPGAIRVGVNDWEFGLLSQSAFGLVKLFRDADQYFSFGITIISSPTVAGLFGSVGFDWNFLWNLTLRGELNAAGYHNGFAKGEANVGIGIYF